MQSGDVFLGVSAWAKALRREVSSFCACVFFLSPVGAI